MNAMAEQQDVNPKQSALKRRVAKSLVILCACGWLAACDRNDGPVERAGERVDEFATDVGNAVEDKCEDVKKESGAEDTDC